MNKKVFIGLLFAALTISNCTQKENIDFNAYVNPDINPYENIDTEDYGDYGGGSGEDYELNCCEFYYYYQVLLIRFEDDSGNDLLKGIGYDSWLHGMNPEEDSGSGLIDNELFSLEIISDVSEQFDKDIKDWAESLWPNTTVYFYNDPRKLILQKLNGDCFLRFCLESPQTTPFSFFKIIYPPAKWFTFKLNCPYIFGEDKVYEINTHWEFVDIHSSPKSSIPEAYRYCNRVVFEGKEVQLQENSNNSITATIVLKDRK